MQYKVFKCMSEIHVGVLNGLCGNMIALFFFASIQAVELHGLASSE